MNKQIIKLSLFLLLGYFFIFPPTAHAVIPPDFVFNVGTHVAQFFVATLLFFTFVFGTSLKFIKAKYHSLKHKKSVLVMIIASIVAFSLASSYFYATYRQKSEYQAWLAQSKKFVPVKNKDQSPAEDQSVEVKEKKDRKLNYDICKIIESRDSRRCSSLPDVGNSVKEACVISFSDVNYLPGILKSRRCDAAFCSDKTTLDILSIASKDECDYFCQNLANMNSVSDCNLLKNKNYMFRLICGVLNGENGLCAPSNNGCRNTLLMFDAIMNDDPSKLDSLYGSWYIIPDQVSGMISGKKCEELYGK